MQELNWASEITPVFGNDCMTPFLSFRAESIIGFCLLFLAFLIFFEFKKIGFLTFRLIFDEFYLKFGCFLGVGGLGWG